MAGALSLPDVDGVPGPTAGDFAIYMYSNPTSVTQTGIPYSSIVTPNADYTPNFTNDSGHDIDVSSPTTGSFLTGGKLTMYFPTGVCFPHNETITFSSKFERAAN